MYDDQSRRYLVVPHPSRCLCFKHVGEVYSVDWTVPYKQRKRDAKKRNRTKGHEVV